MFLYIHLFGGKLINHLIYRLSKNNEKLQIVCLCCDQNPKVTNHLIHYFSNTYRHYSLIGGGDSVLAVVVPRGVLIQHLCPVWCPRHDVQPVTGLQRVLTPRPRLMLRLKERWGRLDAEQWAGTHENWKTGVRKGRQQDARKKRKRQGEEEQGGKWGREKSGKIVKAGVGWKWIDTWKMDWIRCVWCSKKKKNEEKKREGFKTPALISRGKQQKRRKCSITHC